LGIRWGVRKRAEDSSKTKAALQDGFLAFENLLLEIFCRCFSEAFLLFFHNAVSGPLEEALSDFLAAEAKARPIARAAPAKMAVRIICMRGRSDAEGNESVRRAKIQIAHL